MFVLIIWAIISLGIAFAIVTFLIFSAVGDFLGAPFVPTSSKVIREILERAKLKKGGLLIELGSGDGRVVTQAVKEFGLKGLGVEIHPMLVLYAKVRAKLLKLKNLTFKTQNFYQTDLSKADVLFLFLLPETLKKLREKFERECKKGTLIISHGFRIPGFEKKLIDTIERKSFSTYYYRV